VKRKRDLDIDDTEMDVVVGDAVLDAMEPKEKERELRARKLIKAGMGTTANRCVNVKNIPIYIYIYV
jgi:hypothetical protein